MAEVFQVELGLGSVKALEERVSEALKQPVEAAQAAIEEQDVVNVDETGWRQENQRAWLWVAVSKVATVFQIGRSRAGKVCQELLGEGFHGIVGTDRWSGYNWIEPMKRQVCWAHLRRDFEAFVERGGESARIGEGLLKEAEQMFGWWHQVQEGSLSRREFEEKMQAVQARVGQLLREGANCGESKTEKTCQNVLKVEQALFTFVRVEGVEPTNNAAERAVRGGVLWRKTSFGTQSEAGSRFAERMMTVVATLKQQGRNVLDYLIGVLEAKRRGKEPPSLLPHALLPHAPPGS
jgi:transposase